MISTGHEQTLEFISAVHYLHSAVTYSLLCFKFNIYLWLVTIWVQIPGKHNVFTWHFLALQVHKNSSEQSITQSTVTRWTMGNWKVFVSSKFRCHVVAFPGCIPEVLFALIKYHQSVGCFPDLHYEFPTDPVWDCWPCFYNTLHISSWLWPSLSSK